MSSAKQLLEERGQLWSQMTSILDTAEEANRELTPDERATYDATEVRLDEVSADIERQERFLTRGKDLNAAPPIDVTGPKSPDDERSSDKAYEEAFGHYVRSGRTDMPTEQRKILAGGSSDDKELRAAAIGTSAAGGYLVPQGFRQKIIETQKQFGAVQNVAEVIHTSTGAPLPWPTNDDTGNVGALLAENTALTEQDVVLGVKTLGAYMYTSKLIRVSFQFLQDVDWMDSESWLAKKFGQRLGRVLNQHFTTGTGTAQPQGIVTGATSGLTAASATLIAADELIDLQHTVDPAYRAGAKFMMGDVALKQIRKLKDTTNQYIFQPSYQLGVPNTLLGSEYVINVDMAAPATTVKSVLYGDFAQGYVIRIVKDFQMVRLDERYADFLQVGFFAFERADGLVQDPLAYKALTQL